VRLRAEGKEVVAYATVAVQRQGGSVFRVMPRDADDYDTVPNKTPAEGDAATTVGQNETWRTHRYADDVERKILEDIWRSLHPKADK
jgi:hypothetical protein